MEQKFSSKKCLAINNFVRFRIKICKEAKTNWPKMKKKIIFVCKQNFLIWTKRKLRILIHGLHYRSHHLGWLTLESLVAKKKWKKRLGAWERYLVCRQMRFVFLLGNSTFDPMQQSEAAAFWSHFWSCNPSKKRTIPWWAYKTHKADFMDTKLWYFR